MKRHKVFVSYHHANDQVYRDKFEEMFSEQHDIMVSKSVQIGDIGNDLRTETVRQKIRDEYLRDSTVTIVLIGKETWKRKHVDWEIGASIRDTKKNPRSGLLGVFLPSYPLSRDSKLDPYTIPPRLYNNFKCDFAHLYNWTNDPNQVQKWIHKAFKERYELSPDNSYPSFVNNRNGEKWQ